MSTTPSRSVLLPRRAALQVGYSGAMGLGLAPFMSRAAAAKATQRERPRRAKHVIVIFLTGAPSHHDTFDMKVDAPAEVRGEFKAIDTRTPGLQVCEHLPLLAQRSEHYAIVRSLSHKDNNHLMSTHHVLTGHLQPGAFFDKVASRDDWPCYSAALDYLRPRGDALPSGVNLPTFLMQNPLTWPGQHAGLLGPKHDPWQITGDPNSSEFRVDALQLSEGINVDRFQDRQSLLAQLNAQQQRLSESAECRQLTGQQELIFSLLSTSKLSKAFELNHESDATRDRYGRNTNGQSLLIARRLVQVGVPLVQVNMGRVQTWDNHGNIFPTLKDRLLPPVDHGVSALLDDLVSTGLLDDTFVMLLGEFGRTPKINPQQGRDHWGPCFFGLFAGAGVQGGQVIGKSDAIGAYPITQPYSPDDIGATLYHLLGVDPASELRDRLNRPLQLNHGALIEPLFSGRAS